MSRLAVLSVAVCVLVAQAVAIEQTWMRAQDDPTHRAAALLAEMTLSEKVAMLHGSNEPAGDPCRYVGYVVGNDRLGIPPLRMNDGPQGYRDNDHPKTTTAWPSGLTIAASWDADLMQKWGAAMGKEFRLKGSNIQLGPGVNVARVPQNGRNFEYISGEDPLLGYVLAKPAVAGIQSQGVLATVKHYVLNNQETDRGFASSNADEATRYETYYPPFEAAVEAGVASAMCSYNKIYGVWSCENPTTLRDDLKKSLNFTGFVMSDWGGTHSTSIREGLDIEMPAGDFMGDTLLQLVSNGTIDVSFVDDSIMRILVPMFQFGLFDNYRPDPSLTCTNNVTSVEHNDLARTLSAASTILLKNDAPLNATSPLLPLNLNDPTLTSIAVIGLADIHNAITHGGGSGAVDPSRVVSPLAGILAHVNGRVKVLYDDGTDLNRASALAASCSVAIVFVGASNGREGHDRTTLAVDFLLDDLVEHVSSHQPRVVVVVSAPGAVLVPWRNHVPALVLNLLGGQEVGSAIADVLFGQVNPSARLPITLPLTDNDQQFSISQFPGLPADVCEAHQDGCVTTYSEGAFFGYRFYDANSMKPMFPFGHGLSYTSFAYADIDVTVLSDYSIQIDFTLQNVGFVDGAEVAQAYLSAPSASGLTPPPPQSLAGFQKVHLAAGEKRRISITVLPRASQRWSVSQHQWQRVSGDYVVKVGASSRDHRLQRKFVL